MMTRCLRISIYFTAGIVLLWVLGRLLSDRWYWSQWISWIPTIIVIGFLSTTTLLALVTKSKIKSYAFSVLTISLASYYATVENNFFSSRNSLGDLRLVGWTMSHSKKSISKESADELVRLHGDITILTHGWYVRSEPVIEELLGPNNRRIINGPFTLLTKFKPLEVRTLIASDGVFVSLFRIDTTEKLGRPISVWAIDLPSSFYKSKMSIVQRTKSLLESVHSPLPDIVIGDFNITRNSASMSTLFPTLHDASDEAGIGLIASYPRLVPLFHIDHVLLNTSLKAKIYTLINPNLGRHRVQVCEVSNAID